MGLGKSVGETSFAEPTSPSLVTFREARFASLPAAPSTWRRRSEYARLASLLRSRRVKRFLKQETRVARAMMSIMARARFTAIFEKHGRWYVGYVPEVPGVHSQERTLAAARRSLTTALRELAEISPDSVRGRHRQIEKIEVELGE